MEGLLEEVILRTSLEIRSRSALKKEQRALLGLHSMYGEAGPGRGE